MNFDARTLLIVGGFLCWILAAAIEFKAVRSRHQRILPDPWTLGLLAKGLGMNLISQRGLVPDVWSISLAHALLLIGLLFFYTALQRVRGVPANRLLMAAMPVGLAVLLPLVGFSGADFKGRVLVIMTAWLFGFALGCWSAVHLVRMGYRFGASLVLASNVILAVPAIAFAFAVITGDVPGVFAASGAHLAFYAVADLCILLGTIGYLELERSARSRPRATGDSMQPDKLTGLYSSEAFLKIGDAELRRAEMRNNPVSAMAIRIDRLDEIRALGGPSAVDRALQRVAAIVLKEVRMFDIAGRVSAELICVVMPEMTLAAGHAVAERIRSLVQNDAMSQEATARIEISVGVEEAQGTTRELEGLMAMAAACLERAQEEGGNRVAIREGSVMPSLA